jgi:transcriptional regulator with XRE-family HTH domain
LFDKTHGSEVATAAEQNQAIPKTLGTLLKTARRRTGMTQSQLAGLSSVSVRAIRDLELDLTRQPRRETLRLLMDALRLSGPRRAELEEAAAGLAPQDVFLDELPPPPAPLGPILGRDRDVESLTELLETGGHRLVRVVGVAGVGKTRLIQEVARASHRDGRMPVIWVDTRRTAHEQAWTALQHRVAGLLRGEPELDGLVATLATRRVLLAVNGKGLEPGAETALRLLLESCPGLQVLYETHEPSQQPEGTDYSVFPLAAPEWPYEAAGDDPVPPPSLQLMLARCGRLRPESRSDKKTMAAIAGICWYLDGIPQALEAAASSLLFYQSTRLLDIAIHYPFQIMGPPSGNEVTLRASLAASVASLRPRDAQALRKLAVADRPWTVEQAVSSLGGRGDDSLSEIHLLCTRGLVRPAGRTGDGAPRFTVLNLVRHVLADGDSAAAATDASVPPQQVPVATS